MAIRDTTAEVGIDIVGGDLKGTLEFIERKVAKISQMVAEAGNAAAASSSAVNRKFDTQMQAYQRTLGQLRIIEGQIRAAGQGGVNSLVQDKAFARRTADATAYAKTVQNAVTLTEALQARINTLDKQNAAIGSRNELLSRKQEAATTKARQNLAELQRIDAEIARLNQRARRTDGVFTPQSAAVAAARSALEAAALNPRRSNFTAELAALNAALDAYAVKLTGVRAAQAQAALIQRTLMAAEIRGMTTIAEIEAARNASIQKRIALEAILVSGTAKQKKEALELLALEERRLALLQRQQRAVAPATAAPAAVGGPAPLFGNAGLSGVLMRTAAYSAAGAAIYGVVGALHTGASASIEFEEKLAQLGAISGSTETQMNELGDSILRIAQNSKYSSSELVEAATQLAQAGYSAQGVGAALKAASDLAAASGTSVSASVDVMTATMGAFQLQEQDATMVANGLTAALNKSRLALPQVALGIQYAGVTAKEQNLSFEDLTAAMAAMAQAGVRSGSTMGTGIRQFLTDLASPTEKLSATLTRLGLSFADVDVATLGLPQVLQNLSAAGFSASEAYGSMEKRGAAAYLAMRSQLPVFNEVKLAMSNQTAAADAAAKAAESLAGAWQKAKNRMFASWEQDTSPMSKWLTELLTGLEVGAEKLEILAKRRAEMEKAGVSQWTQLSGDPTRRSTVNAIYDDYEKQLKSITEAEEALIDVNDKFGASLELSNTQAAKSVDAYNAGKTSLVSLEGALQSVTQRSGSLKDGSQALEAETISLMSRYPDLARNVNTATDSYMDLIAAMKAARGDMILTNAALAAAAGQDQVGAAQIKWEQGNALLQKVYGSRGFAQLSREDRQIFSNFQHGGAGDARKIAALSGISNARPDDSADVRATRMLIRQMQTVFTERLANKQSGANYTAAAAQMTAANTDALKGLTAKVDGLSKPGTTEAQKNNVIAQLTGAETAVRRMMVGKTGPELVALQGVADATAYQKARAQGTLNSTGKFSEPKASKAAASEGNPIITRADLVGAVKDIAPQLGVGSGYRSQTEQDALVAAGKTQAKVSNHTSSLAQDFKLPKGAKITKDGVTFADGSVMTKVQFEQALKARGINAKEVIFETGAGKNQGTGPHIHVALKKNQRKGAANESLATAREDLSNDEYALKNSSRALEFEMRQLSKTTSKVVFDQGIANTKLAYEDWEAKLRAATASQISVEGFGANNAQVRLDEMEQLILQKKEELGAKIADGIVKNLNAQFKTIDAIFDKSLAPSDAAVASARGTVEGLNRYGVDRGVPSYVKTLAEKRAREAEEARQKALMPATRVKLDSKIEAVGRARFDLSMGLARGDLSPGQLLEATTNIENMQASIDDLAASYANMQAQANAPSMIQTSLSANITQAVEAWRELHGSTKNYAQLIGEEVGPAIDMLQSSFSTLFSDIMSGSTSVGAAFGNFAKGIIRAIQEIVAKILATQVINLLMSFIPGGGGGGGGFGGAISAIGSAIGSYHGGRVQGRANGGRVETGFPGRDSSLYNLAKGEWVVRGAAVKSVGNDFMRDLNEHGASAVKRRTAMAVMGPGARQEVAVYVVAPTEKPSMGPNDVTVHMQSELLKDGATKKLIRHIAQGG